MYKKLNVGITTKKVHDLGEGKIGWVALKIGSCHLWNKMNQVGIRRGGKR